MTKITRLGWEYWRAGERIDGDLYYMIREGNVDIDGPITPEIIDEACEKAAAELREILEGWLQRTDPR